MEIGEEGHHEMLGIRKWHWLESEARCVTPILTELIWWLDCTGAAGFLRVLPDSMQSFQKLTEVVEIYEFDV